MQKTVLGAGGRQFESGRPDHLNPLTPRSFEAQLLGIFFAQGLNVTVMPENTRQTPSSKKSKKGVFAAAKCGAKEMCR